MAPGRCAITRGSRLSLQGRGWSDAVPRRDSITNDAAPPRPSGKSAAPDGLAATALPPLRAEAATGQRCRWRVGRRRFRGPRFKRLLRRSATENGADEQPVSDPWSLSALPQGANGSRSLGTEAQGTGAPPAARHHPPRVRGWARVRPRAGAMVRVCDGFRHGKGQFFARRSGSVRGSTFPPTRQRVLMCEGRGRGRPMDGPSRQEGSPRFAPPALGLRAPFADGAASKSRSHRRSTRR
jgi:hypothetical protein